MGNELPPQTENHKAQAFCYELGCGFQGTIFRGRGAISDAQRQANRHSRLNTSLSGRGHNVSVVVISNS